MFGCRGDTPAIELGASVIYQRQVLDLLLGLIATGIIGQCVAASMMGQPFAMTFSIVLTCSAIVGVTKYWQTKVHPLLLQMSIIAAGLSTACGLFYLNGGWDGSHLYPLLWAFSIVSGVGMYGSWSLVWIFMGAGVFVAVGGRLACPDLTFGTGADQSWTRVVATLAWWFVALAGAGFTGRRVIGVTKASEQARQAMQSAQAQENSWKLEAERLQLAVATERAEALSALAREFDAQVRSVVTTVAQTSLGIEAHATAVDKAAGATGRYVDEAEKLSIAVAQDTDVVAITVTQLSISLDDVREQAQGAKIAAVQAT